MAQIAVIAVTYFNSQMRGFSRRARLADNVFLGNQVHSSLDDFTAKVTAGRWPR